MADGERYSSNVNKKTIKVAEYVNVSKEDFIQKIYAKREPAVLRGLDIGQCLQKWNLPYLQSQLGSIEVKVHVTTTPQMDFLNKNFAYRTLTFGDLIQRVFEDVHTEYFFDEREKYYLRSLGSNPRKEVANLDKQFPQLASDICIPQLFDPKRFFSSVFRIGSSGVQLWTHYDIMDNILMQILGRKRVVLFSPKDALNLYLDGDKSQVLDIEEPDLNRFPRFAAVEHHETVLEPGDVLFIPALWFHNTVAVDPNVAINVFWQHLDPALYDGKDVYGNRDLLPATRALQLITKATELLETLPECYKDFYGRRAVDMIQNKTFTP